MNYLEKVLHEPDEIKEIIRLFFMEPVPKEEIDKYTKTELEEVAITFLNLLLNIKIDKIIELIEKNYMYIKEIDSKNIPQFSNINNIDKVLNIISSNENILYKDIGYYFNKNASEIAQQKYGENHYKICSQIGFTTEKKPYSLTFIGEEYKKFSKDEKEDLKTKLMLRIPIIQYIIVNAKKGRVSVMELLEQYVAKSTAVRRRSNIKVIVNKIVDLAGNEYKEIINNNIDWK